MNALIWFLICLCVLGLFALVIFVLSGDVETDRELEALDKRMRGEE